MKARKSEKKPIAVLLWTAMIGLVFGLIGFGEIFEDRLRTLRNAAHIQPASGEIVLIGIDDKSLSEVGGWPWPRARHAELADQLTAAGARRIFFDIIFDGASTKTDDRRLAESLAKSSPATIPVRLRSGHTRGNPIESAPLPMIARNAELGSISVVYNYENAVWRLAFGTSLDGKPLPTFAAKLAGREVRPGGFMVDYSIDPASVPFVSAGDILSGRFDPRSIEGKDVVIAATSEILGDQYFLPGWGKMAGAYVQILGAETLKSGSPRHYGWAPAFLLAIAIAVLAIRQKSPLRKYLIFLAAGTAFAVVPIALEAQLIFVDITPALFVIVTTSTVLAWRRYRRRGLINPISELPNLSALQDDRSGRDKALIAARILNYAEIVATLPPEGEKALIEQIIARLNVGSPDRLLYQGDGGIFAWFENTGQPFGHHLEALYSLFRNPARLDGMAIDVAISFGVEIGSSRSIGNRLGSALVAAEEAAHDGLKWKFHDPESLQNASWRLSMLSQLDDAVDKGEVWVAFQPKLDLATREIVGAEALARWTHPQKGPIAASEFIAAAEQHDRIGKLTDFVLEQSVAAAVEINRRKPGFGVAVNLSARLLADKSLVLRLSAMLSRHGLAPHLLTLELTETATLSSDGSAIDMLSALRDLGVQISIDDYGTGLSTLEYLKKVPAGEIKIDQSFVMAMLENRSDRLMVQSTIGLAHSLGRKVVAEGVERKEILDVLVEMQCDYAQGFAVGRPMSLGSLIKRVRVKSASQVA